jgi:hypothetical protein
MRGARIARLPLKRPCISMHAPCIMHARPPSCRYTGVGLQDLVRRSCVNLHQRLKLICDGVEVPLPYDAEGLVILNIGCHMVRESV